MITVTQLFIIFFVLVFAISIIAFLTKESKTGSYTDGLAISIFQGFLIAFVIMIPITYCTLVLGINPFK